MTSIPVLMYHHISDDREVTLSGFEKQLQYLKENNYRTLSLEEFYIHIIGEKQVKQKAVLITFDDGYADNWICAYPLLKKYGFNAVVFVTTENINRSPNAVRETIEQNTKSPDTLTDERGENGFLSWQEVKKMYDGKVFEIGSHTHTHKNFNKNSDYENLEQELKTSADLIEKNIGIRPISLAWPWGHYKKSDIPFAKKAGYKMVFTTKNGANAKNGRIFEICRFKVKCSNINWFKRRLFVYQSKLLSNIYETFYGLDSKLKRIIKN